jgi:hypothetical protein
MELMFDELQHNPCDAAIETHDAVLKVVNTDASIKVRLLACQELLRRWR